MSIASRAYGLIAGEQAILHRLRDGDVLRQRANLILWEDESQASWGGLLRLRRVGLVARAPSRDRIATVADPIEPNETYQVHWLAYGLTDAGLRVAQQI